MAIAARPPGHVRAIIFDLDEALLVRGEAWRYALEEAVISVTGRRVDARPLVAEYHVRPWRHALGIVVDDPRQIGRCEELCAAMYARSAMKKLLVHEGMGMALDRLRGDRIEMGAISREPHAIALKQVQSTGLDRFLSVLSPTPPGAPWDVVARTGDCLAYLDRAPGECAFVSGDSADLGKAAATGIRPWPAGWAATLAGANAKLTVPDDLWALARMP